MLYPHSLLWHYLWVGPHVLQVVLAALLWRRGINKVFPVFFVYIVYEAIEELTLYAMDVIPFFSVRAWWIACCVGAVVEGLLKFAVVWEVFSDLIRSRPSQTHLGKMVIAGSGAVLFVVAVWTAVHAPIATQFPIASYMHILGQSIYMITCGLWLSTFLLAAFFHLEWKQGGFLECGQTRYLKENNELVVPIHLEADCQHQIVINSSPRALSRGFMSSDGLPAASAEWKFRTKSVEETKDGHQ